MATISGSHGSDKLKGTSKDDVLKGGGGNDVIKGGKGNDNINGGTGDDKIYGGAGDDIIDGNIGIDELYGEDGNDILSFSGQISDFLDYAHGGDGNDTFTYLFNNWGGASIYDYEDYENFYDEYGEIINANGLNHYGGPGDDTFLALHDKNTLIATTAALGALNLDGGSGNDKFTVHNNFYIPKDSGYLINGGDGYDILHISDDGKANPSKGELDYLIQNN